MNQRMHSSVPLWYLLGLPVPPKNDDPMETDAPAASSTPAPPAEGSTEGSTQPAQDVDMTRGEPGDEQAASTTPTTTTTEPPVHKLPIDPDAASYLPECITHTAKLLESMFSNHDTCQKFVQQGGVECLLQLYKLPKLPPTFGSSSASHSLLATFRALTVHSAADIATRLQPALASQFRITLGTAEVCLQCYMSMALPVYPQTHVRHVCMPFASAL